MKSLVAQVEDIIESSKDKIYSSLENDLDLLCRNLIDMAVTFRYQHVMEGRGHNYTGNLLNSMVCALYKRGTLLRTYHPNVRPEMYRKMTLSGGKKGLYVFSIDYDGQSPSYYRPEVKTDTGFGKNDATAFVRSYISMKGAVYEVVVAYTTEYADWLEIWRQNTGYMQMKEFIHSINIDSFVNTPF